MSEKQKAKIKNWHITKRSNGHRLFGDIIEHPLLAKDEAVITTSLLYVDFQKMIAETENTVYELV